MAALILTLQSLGWDPVEPDRWHDDAGGTWAITSDAVMDFTPIWEQLTASVQRLLWKQAGQHPEGKGLEDGADLTVLRKELQRYRRKGKHDLAGAMECAAVAAIWNGARCKACGYQTSGQCDRCSEGCEDNNFHRIWECRANDAIDGPCIQKTQDLRSRALAARRDGTADAFWTRGMPPTSWNTVPAPPDWDDFDHVHVFGQHLDDPVLDCTTYLLNPSDAVHAMTAFLDGSLTSEDARVGRAGWGVVIRRAGDAARGPETPRADCTGW